MSILGKVVKGTAGLCADSLDYLITKSADGITNKYGENEYVKTASEIGSSSVRATEITVKNLTEAVDGGIEAGVGYLTQNQSAVNKGWERSRIAGQNLGAGIGKGLAYTVAAGTRTAASAAQAGKHYVQGEKDLARQELGATKGYAKSFAKVVATGLLAFGPATPAKTYEPGE